MRRPWRRPEARWRARTDRREPARRCQGNPAWARPGDRGLAAGLLLLPDRRRLSTRRPCPSPRPGRCARTDAGSPCRWRADRNERHRPRHRHGCPGLRRRSRPGPGPARRKRRPGPVSAGTGCGLRGGHGLDAGPLQLPREPVGAVLGAAEHDGRASWRLRSLAVRPTRSSRAIRPARDVVVDGSSSGRLLELHGDR